LLTSSRPLSTNATAAAQISFVNEGKDLVITERATNKIITYTIKNGLPGDMHSVNSANATPFGFGVGKNGNIFVSEAAGGANLASSLSSYHIQENGEISLINGPIATLQTAACWVAITNNGKFAFTSNAGNSSTISAFNTTSNGSINLSQSVAATPGTGPVDAAISKNSKYYYVLANGAHQISAYKIGNDGSLTFIQSLTGINIGANGLVAN
jgi:6-phosphogluconolactonase